MTTEITLDVCTPEGKTWMARVTGVGGSYGIEREFINPAERNLSRSGRTGKATYVLDDGLYESNEGRRRFGRRFWEVRDGEITEISREQLVARF